MSLNLDLSDCFLMIKFRLNILGKVRFPSQCILSGAIGYQFLSLLVMISLIIFKVASSKFLYCKGALCPKYVMMGAGAEFETV